MARNWDDELKKVDRQLESLSDEALLPTKGTSGAARVEAVARQQSTSTLGVLIRLVLSAALGVGMAFWPYDTRCGLNLAGYLGALAVLGGAGLWSAVWTWRHRSGRGHVLSLAILTWGAVLAAQEILPRIGYATPTPGHPAMWTCP